MATIKAQGPYDVADPYFDPYDGDQYDQQLFEEKQSFVYSVLVTSLQTDKGRELVKDFEGDARTIISKLHHYHTSQVLHEVVTLTTYITNLNNGGNIKPKSTLGQPNLKPEQVHFHENDCLPDNSSMETSTQTMVHECLSDGGMDPYDNNNVMSAFKAMAGNPPQESPRKIKTHQRYDFSGGIQSTKHRAFG